MCYNVRNKKITTMKHIVFAGVLIFSLALSFFPNTVSAAGLVPCGRSVNDPATTTDETVPCTLCHIVLGADGVIKWFMSIMTIIAVTVIFAMGVLYIVSTGDQGMMETAKEGIKAALVGFTVMLLAWLTVNIILTVLVDKASPEKPFLGLMKTNTFEFSCDAKSNSLGK